MARRIRFVLIMFFAVSFALSCFESSFADEIEREHIITVIGKGKASMKPDSFKFELIVETESSRLKSAHADNAKKISNIIEAIKKLNIPNIEFSTVDFKFGSDKSFNLIIPGKNYTLQNLVMVKAETVEYEKLALSAASAIDEAIVNGATRISGLEFYLKDEEQAEAIALKSAIEDANGKANLVAKELGVTIKEPYNLSTISQVILEQQRPEYMEYSIKSFSFKEATQLAPGSKVSTVEVTAEFKF